MGRGMCHLTAHRQRNFSRQKRRLSARRDAQPPEAVISECERSLARFKTDVIDGYSAHGDWSDAFYEAAVKLKQQGKIRFIGLSCHVPEKHRLRVEAGTVDFTLQPPLRLAGRHDNGSMRRVSVNSVVQSDSVSASCSSCRNTLSARKCAEQAFDIERAKARVGAHQ